MADIHIFEKRLRRIRRRLRHLRYSGPFKDKFGVSSHRFKVGTPLSEEEVARFEREYALRLPEDFRAFVIKLGVGGAGPYYGILPMSQWGEVASEATSTGEWGQSLGRSCPLPPELPYDLSWMDQVRLGPGDHPYQGLLAVCHCGCHYYCTLVVSGPARGRKPRQFTGALIPSNL